MLKKNRDEVLNLTKLLENSELFYATLSLVIERFAYEQNENPAAVAGKIMGSVILSKEEGALR